MTKEAFTKYLIAPETVDQEASQSISNLLESHPYFQSAQLLLSKAYQITDHLKFESQLKKAAAYAADRSLLHRLLMGDQISTRIETAERIKKDENSLTEGSLSSKNKVEDRQPNTQDVKHPKDTEEEGTPPADEYLNRQILAEAVNSSILKEAGNELPEIDALNPKAKEKAKAEEQVEITIHEDSKAGNQEVFNESEDHAFSDWLKHYRIEENEKDEQRLAVAEEDKLLWEKSQLKTIQEKLPIQASAKKEFYSAAKMARLSVQENDDLVTETLASIYADQGKYEKAIQAFKKLQLKYPEKSSYFASRIKSIEQKLNLE